MISLSVRDFETPSSKLAVKNRGDVENSSVRAYTVPVYFLMPVKGDKPKCQQKELNLQLFVMSSTVSNIRGNYSLFCARLM